MKIGILTFHRAHNYGAVLQAYALEKYLESKGNVVEVVDYLSKVNSASNLIWFFKRRNIFALLINLLFKFYRIYKRFKKFNSFINKTLNLSSTIMDINQFYKLDYDVYIVGSDQVWNDEITKGFDPIYFGAFDTKNKSLKITYAVSMGEKNTLSKNEITYIKNNLSNFNSISVRENMMLELLSPYFNNTITKVLDPTLIVNKELFNSLLCKPKAKRNYVLVYQVAYSRYIDRFAKKIADQLYANIIFVESNVRYYIPRMKHIEAASPEEFLGLIKYASCIITTSFHGIAFSIIFEKPFYLFGFKTHSNRPVSLLNQLNLNERIIKGNDNNVFFTKIDYSCVNDLLNEQKQISEEFLSKSLNVK